jgi:hypothetical protein
MSLPENTQASPAELVADTAEVASEGLLAAEVVLIGAAGLLFCPPLAVLAVLVVVPAAVVMAAVAAVVGMIAAPFYLVRRAREHHRAHGKTLFLHRLVR